MHKAFLHVCLKSAFIKPLLHRSSYLYSSLAAPLKMCTRELLLISSSNVAGYKYLECPKNDIIELLQKKNVEKILFIPYAMKNHDEYLQKIVCAIKPWGFDVEGLHQAEDPVVAVRNAQAIFVGGGNTFLLLNTLISKALIEPIRKRVLMENVPYIGTSAGTNVATVNIKTTNDMPIVFPQSFDALNLVPFNINPHYLDVDPKSKHQGETRETRIREFLEHNTNPVLGLREGASLLVVGNTATLKGIANARLFRRDKEPQEFKPDDDLSFLLEMPCGCTIVDKK